ncbi:MAG: hypothetical protein L3K23_02650 [Thermoplasmata archaeon]|nr:hypothetical protein [Thermoplasmata archaeon]
MATSTDATTTVVVVDSPNILRRLLRWLNEPSRRTRLELSFAVAALFTATILVYTRGNLLYGEDYPGIYSLQDFALRPIPDFLIPALAVGLTGGNIYVGFYLALGVEAFVVSYACQLFARELFTPAFTEKELTVVQGLAAVFYVMSPAAVITSYKSLIGIVFLSAAGFFLVMTLILRLARRLTRGWSFRPYDAALLGLGIGLAMPDSFPNQLRMLGLTVGTIGAILVWFTLFPRSEAQWFGAKKALRNIVLVTIPIALALLADALYLIVTQWGSDLKDIHQVSAAYVPVFTGTTYNSLPLVVRLLGKHSFNSLIYASLYQTNPIVVFASYLWPLLAIVVPTAFAYYTRMRTRRWIYGIELVIVACVIWDTGTNPPFGALTGSIQNALPFGATLLPTYYLSLLVLSKIYPVMIAFSIVVTAEWARRWVSRHWRPAKSKVAAPKVAVPAVRPAFRLGARTFGWSGTLAIAAITVLILVAAVPIFAGQVEGGGARKGFAIPDDYFVVRHLLQSAHANAVLLPAISLYFTEIWGYQGANSFFINFNYPSQVVVPGFWGPYSYYLNSTQEAYNNATTLVEPGGNATAVTPPVTPKSFSNSKGVETEVYRLPEPPGQGLNMTNSEWISLEFPNAPPAAVQALISASELQIGIESNNSGTIGWYSIGAGSNSYIDYSGATGVAIDLIVGNPTSSIHYNSSYISQIYVQEQGISEAGYVEFGHLTVGSVVTGLVSPVWLAEMQALGVTYVLEDHNIRKGAGQSFHFVTYSINTLLASGYLTPVYNDTSLFLYQIR